MSTCRLDYLLSVLLFVSIVKAQPAPETLNKFRIQVHKAMSGTEEYTIKKTDKGYLLQGITHLQRGATAIDLKQEQITGQDGNLVRYTLEGTVGEQPQKVEAWVEGQQVAMEAAVGDHSQKKAIELRPNTIVLDNLVVSHFQVLMNRLDSAPPDQFWLIVPQVLSAIPGKLSRERDESGRLDGKPIAVRKYRLEAGGVAEEIWATEDRALMQVNVPMQEVEIVRDGFVLDTKPAEPEKPGPEAFLERQVVFPSAGVQMPGTLCLPAKLTGKVPVVVLVHGSGPHDRDEKVGPNYPFRDLAHGLAAAGVASLRYDKRTFAFASPPDRKRITLDWEVTNDAVAALQYAATIPEIDPSAQFVLGHSLGGTMAPYIAERYAKTRGIILLAAAAMPIELTLAKQKRLALKAQGKSEQEIEEELQSQNQIFADIRSGKTPATSMIDRVPASYWRDWMNRDPAGELKKMNLPVLVLQGGRDAQVYEADYDRLQKALSVKQLGMAEFHWFPTLNHLFMPAEGNPAADYSKPGYVDHGVIEIIANWVRKQTGMREHV